MSTNGAEEYCCRGAATDQERQKIFALRYEVYVAEMGKRPTGLDHEQRIVRDELDGTAHHLYVVAGEGETVVGSVRINWLDETELGAGLAAELGIACFKAWRPAEISYVSNLMIASGLRQKKLAYLLFQGSYRAGMDREPPTRFALVAVRPVLLRMYDIFGFRRFMAVTSPPAGRYLVPLVLINDDVAYLAQIGSPFAELARELPTSNAETWARSTFGDQLLPPCGYCNAADLVGELREHPQLATLDAEPVRKLAEYGSLIVVPDGTTLVDWGEPLDAHYYALSGRLALDDADRSSSNTAHCENYVGVDSVAEFWSLKRPLRVSGETRVFVVPLPLAAKCGLFDR